MKYQTSIDPGDLRYDGRTAKSPLWRRLLVAIGFKRFGRYVVRERFTVERGSESK